MLYNLKLDFFYLFLLFGKASKYLGLVNVKINAYYSKVISYF